MERRNFLAMAVAASAAPLSVGAGVRPSSRIKVLDTYLTNADQFPQGSWPAPGSPLALRRDPLHAFDTRSVAVVDPSGTPLDYVPPASAEVLAALMDNGTAAVATAGAGGKLSMFLNTA